MDENTIDLTTMLYDVAKQKHDYILETDDGDKSNQIATEEFVKCMEVYRELQKDSDDCFLENRRIDNDVETNRKSEQQRIWFDRCKIVIEAGTLVLTGVGLIMSFATLREYQEINLESVIRNKDAVKSANNLFDSMFRRLN
jgi:hypothetical protein